MGEEKKEKGRKNEICKLSLSDLSLEYVTSLLSSFSLSPVISQLLNYKNISIITVVLSQIGNKLIPQKLSKRSLVGGKRDNKIYSTYLSLYFDLKSSYLFRSFAWLQSFPPHTHLYAPRYDICFNKHS